MVDRLLRFEWVDKRLVWLKKRWQRQLIQKKISLLVAFIMRGQTKLPPLELWKILQENVLLLRISICLNFFCGSLNGVFACTNDEQRRGYSFWLFFLNFGLTWIWPKFLFRFYFNFCFSSRWTNKNFWWTIDGQSLEQSFGVSQFFHTWYSWANFTILKLSTLHFWVKNSSSKKNNPTATFYVPHFF